VLLERKRSAVGARRIAGFTLIEILAAIVVGFFVVIMVYQTFSSVAITSREAERAMAVSPRRFAFFAEFDRIVSRADHDYADGVFSSDELTLHVAGSVSAQEISFAVDTTGDTASIVCTEKDPLFGTEFSWRAMTGMKEASFAYYDGKGWKDAWDKESFPVAIRVSIDDGVRKISYPVVCRSIDDEE